MLTPADVTLQHVYAARQRLRDIAEWTPLVSLPDDPRIHLKLENLQPIGSFKVRGAGNAVRAISADERAAGVFTASAGNMAQGVAYVANELGVAAAAVVPDRAPRAKLDAIAALGARIETIPFDEWWEIIQGRRFEGLPGHFIHPVVNPDVIAGNGTLGLELLEDLPTLDFIVVPFGGGGMICGIAAAVRALKPGVRIIAAEVETAAPLAASLAVDMPVAAPYAPSFVDGIGGRSVLKEMWPLIRASVDESIVVTLDEVGQGVRDLAGQVSVVAEGAAGAALAASRRLRDRSRSDGADGTVACIISGGNIDEVCLAEIVRERVPRPVGADP